MSNLSKTIHCAWIVLGPVALMGFAVSYAAVGVTCQVVRTTLIPW